MNKHHERPRRGLGLAVSTVRNIREILHLIFQFAVINGLIAENPVTKTKLPAPGQSSATSLTVEEANDFVTVKERCWFGSAFVFQLHTGLRNQELMALIWDDVDFEAGTVRIERACKWVDSRFVEFGPTKTRRSNRVLELEAEQLGLLRQHLERQQAVIEARNKRNACYGDSHIAEWIKKARPGTAHRYTNTNLIFPKRNGEVPGASVVRQQFQDMLRQAGIKHGERHIRWYDLRHTHASILLTAGVPVHEVAERMGHSIEMLLRIYAHVLSNRRRIASRVFADLVPI